MISGYVYESDVWDEGDLAVLRGGYFQESVHFWLYSVDGQLYKLPKDEEI